MDSVCCRNNGKRLVIVTISSPCDVFSDFQIYFSLQVRILSGCKLGERLKFGRCVYKCLPHSPLNLKC